MTKIEDKHRPVISTEEIFGLCKLLRSVRSSVNALNLDSVLVRLETLEFKITNGRASPAYQTTGIPKGQAGWSGTSLGLLAVDSCGELVSAASNADATRRQQEIAGRLHQIAPINQPLFIAKEIDTVISLGVKQSVPECIAAVDKFYAECAGITEPTAYWKYLQLTPAIQNLLTVSQIEFIETNRTQEGVQNV